MHNAVGYWVMILICAGISCADKAANNKEASPDGYDLNRPVKYNMPDELLEISGIAFNNGRSDTLYAEQDEEGKVFYFKPGDTQVRHCKFGKKGDYEDIAICRGRVIILRSDGVLFSFPLSQVRNKDAANVQELNGLLPKGEYEGMYADEKTGLLYILCKHCADDRTTKYSSGYILALQANGALKQSGNFGVDVKAIAGAAGEKHLSFHPSGLAKNTKTNEWYLLSSVNKILVVTDVNWNVKMVYPLSASVYNQPEGITFDASNNLYISNEGSKVTAGNVLKFNFKK
ncbi:MAG TPA: SdiA-regulated domain-containing protein [Mucilaginibacter sp.]